MKWNHGVPETSDIMIIRYIYHDPDEGDSRDVGFGKYYPREGKWFVTDEFLGQFYLPAADVTGWMPMPAYEGD